MSLRRGRVVDSTGKPLAGVEVVADNRQFYNTNVLGKTDAKGYYRLDVRNPIGTWHVTAQIKRTLRGQSYTFDLHPEKDDDFNGADGAIRNFTWKMRGEQPDGGRYGSPVIVYGSLSNPYYLDSSNVELTLKPVEALADGSAGAPIVGKVERTGDGDALVDVPLARYEISARYLDPEKGPLPLHIRKRNAEGYSPSVVADFQVLMPGVQSIEVEVQSP